MRQEKRISLKTCSHHIVTEKQITIGQRKLFKKKKKVFHRELWGRESVGSGTV